MLNNLDKDAHGEYNGKCENKQSNTDQKFSNKLINNADCFTYFFNLIITQLFIGSITYIIEFLRLITINILSKFFISERIIRTYGIYIQPLITASLLLFIGFVLYYSINSLIDSCDSGYVIMYTLLVVLVSILIGYLIYVWYNVKTYNKKIEIIKQNI